MKLRTKRTCSASSDSELTPGHVVVFAELKQATTVISSVLSQFWSCFHSDTEVLSLGDHRVRHAAIMGQSLCSHPRHWSWWCPPSYNSWQIPPPIAQVVFNNSWHWMAYIVLMCREATTRSPTTSAYFDLLLERDLFPLATASAAAVGSSIQYRSVLSHFRFQTIPNDTKANNQITQRSDVTCAGGRRIPMS